MPFVLTHRLHITTLLLVFYSHTCFSSSDTVFDMPLEELLKVRVSSVSLKDESIRETPASISVFDQKLIRRLGVDNLADLIRFVPGFQTMRMDDSNVPTVGVRGRSVGAASRQFILLIDGLRVDEWWNGGSLYSMPHLSLIGIERVEFIRGPVSHIYGENAFLGLINIVTGTNHNSIKAQRGNFINYELTAEFGHEQGEFNHHIIVDLLDDEGRRFAATDPFDANNTVYPADPKRAEAITYQANYKGLNTGASYRKTELDDYYSLGGFDESYAENTSEILTSQINYQHEWNADFSTDFKFAYKELERHLVAPVVGRGQLAAISLPSSDEPFAGRTVFTGTEYRFDIQSHHVVSDFVDYRIGMDYRKYRLMGADGEYNFDLNDLATGTIPIRYYGEFRSGGVVIDVDEIENVGVFSHASFSFSQQLSGNIGLRYDDSNIIDGVVSPSASLVYDINDTHTAKLVWGEAYRVPTVIEFFTVENIIISGNRDLEPENVKTTELIWIKQTPQVLWQSSLFYNEFENGIEEAPQIGGGLRYENMGEERSSGVESSISFSFYNHWYFQAVYTHLFTKPDNMFRLAEDHGNAAINYKNAKWNMGVDIDYVGERAFLTDVTMELRDIQSYTLVNSNVAYQLSDAWELSFNVKNLFDEDYFYPANGTSNSSIPARGREYALALEWRL